MTKVTDNHLGGLAEWAEGDIELDPLCFKDAIALAVTNKGVLIPVSYTHLRAHET